MPTQILDKLIQSQWGKSLIMWFFAAMVCLIAALLWALFFMTKELKQANEMRVLDNINHNKEVSELSKAHIAELQSFITRLSAVEKKRRK